MTNSTLARSAAMLAALVVLGACHSGSSTPSTSPAPGSGAAARTAPAPAAKPFTTAMVTKGDSLFHARACARCHGADAKGATNGPDLTKTTHLHIDGSYDSIVKLVTEGVPAEKIKDPSHKFAMQGRGGPRPAPLTDDEIKAVAAYVYSLSHP
jgi:mono/diheme cytochrome c family protein